MQTGRNNKKFPQRMHRCLRLVKSYQKYLRLLLNQMIEVVGHIAMAVRRGGDRVRLSLKVNISHA